MVGALNTHSTVGSKVGACVKYLSQLQEVLHYLARTLCGTKTLVSEVERV